MISIIISSYQEHYFQQISENISQTIGDNIVYEIIKISNPGKMSICAAYNLGAKQSKFGHLLFIHEDILFCENNWGHKLIKTLELPNCGVVGVAGGDYYSYVPASWWNKGHSKLHFIQVDNENKEWINNNLSGKEHEKVKLLDGVFLACTRNVYDDINFDENITGYHGYDLIFSLKAAKKYTNYVTGQILIKHFSSGTLSKQWLVNIIKVRDIIGTFSDQKFDSQLETENFYRLLIYLKKYGFRKRESLKIVLKYLNPWVLGFTNTMKIVNRTKYLIR